MKKNIISRFLAAVVLPACLLTSCDYLDVMPPEQPTAADTMEDKDLMMSFMNSCYHAVLGSNYLHYQNWLQSTDEYVLPQAINKQGQQVSWNQLNSKNYPSIWEDFYTYIGQCHLFLREIQAQDPKDATEEDKGSAINEVNFLKAYYHYRLLEAYGPIPIMEKYPSQTISKEQIPGRRHYDYCVDYIVKMLDQVCSGDYPLPPLREGVEWGRATAATAKAIKSRLLLEAASPLWNGGWPFPDWKNKNQTGDTEYDEKYGLDLVNLTYDESKWQRALDASLEALEYAEGPGQRKLFNTEDAMALYNMKSGLNGDLTKIFIPGFHYTGEEELTEEEKDFIKHVITMRILPNSFESQGNRELLWGYYADGNADRTNKRNVAHFPVRIIYKNNAWQHGWGLATPTLNTVEHFYTKDGYIPADDPKFQHNDEWLFSRAGISGKHRGDIINLHVNREPRFYAWIAYHGDDYAPLMRDGKPLTLDIMGSDDNSGRGKPEAGEEQIPANGWSSAFVTDYPVTGYYNKKWCQIDQQNALSASGGVEGNVERYPMPLFRLAELYLNVAECYANLGEVDKALEYLNPIRERAGVPALTKTMIEKSSMDIIEWVHNERFIEFWDESLRYFDVRRWMKAPQVLRANYREGLNVQVNQPSPSFDMFYQRTVIRQPFQWDDRMYILPVPANEVYSAPNLVQSPNY